MNKRCMGCMELFDEKLEVCPKCGYIEGTPVEEAIHIIPGSLLHNRYIIGRVLGYGSFGVTYIAWDGKLERKVAIKEYMPSEFSTRMPGQSCLTIFSGDREEQFKDGLKKFVDEAKRLAKFNSEPGIVSIFDSFLENDTAYIVMEFLDGETLGDRLKREKTEIKIKNKTEYRSVPIPEDEAVGMLLPVMNSLIAVHKEGIIHRDIAPDNIFITKSGEVKLIDFGASRYATTSHSRSLTTIVKPGSSPKEQYDSRGDQGPHTDVYALAATLYKMITGKTPPEAMGRNAMCETKKTDPLTEPHKIIKNISETRENAILNAMNIRIEDRTPDVVSFINELNSDVPVKRRYGKIKKINLYHWPVWLKIAVPALLAVLIVLSSLLATGVIKFDSLFSDSVVIPDGIVSVPDVEGDEKDEAIQKIREAGLLPSPDGNVESEFVEAGKIVFQSPDGGIYLELNGSVSLTVSSGKGVVAAENGISTVPYIIWDDTDSAISKLKEAGLADPIIETRSDENAAEGKVIDTSVKAGEKVSEDTQIKIIVSSGPAAFDMPNVIDQSKEAAEKALNSKGLVVSVTYEKNDNTAEGKVFKQSIKAGTKVKKGDKVTLTVSSGKPIIKVPNVIGKAKAQAKSSLESSGFEVKILENYDSAVAAGNVINQSPAGGSSQIKGSTVVIYVSKGKPIYQVPSVTGNTEAAAKGALSNFTVEVKYGGYSSSVPYGSVLSQSPAANTSLTEGSKVTITLSKGPDWSAWSETNPNLNTAQYDIQQETRYRYRDKETTTSGNSSLSGWTQYNSSWEWGNYGGWSDWSTSYTSNSASRQTEQKTQYGYYHYKLTFAQGGIGYYPISKDQYNQFARKHGYTQAVSEERKVVYYDNALSKSSNLTYSGIGSFDCYPHQCVGECGDATYASGNKRASYLYYEGTRTLYRYQDRSKIYTYYYYRWGNWSGYSKTAVTDNENRQVETKTYYRYRRK